MPVYQYKGQFYDLAETDPAAAKAKILRHLGQSPVVQTPVSQPAQESESFDYGVSDPMGAGLPSAIAQAGPVPVTRPKGQSVLERYNIEQAGKQIPFTPEEGAALSSLKNIQSTQAQVAQGREIQARQQAARQAQRQAAKEEDYGITDFFKDTGIDVSKGVVGLGEAYVGLLNLTSGGAAGRVLGDLGYDPERTKKFLTGFQSLSRQEADRSVQEAEGFINTLSALGVNPTALVGTVAESLPGTVLSGAVGGKFVRFLAGKAANEATSLGLTGAAAEKFIADRIKEQSFKIAAVASGAEGFQSAGAIAEAARQGGREWSDYILPSLGAGFGTAAIGAVGGKAAAKMGVGDIETSIATRSAGIKGVTPAEGPAFTRILKEAAKEGVFEEMPQSAQEQVFQNLALGKPWDEGVDKAAAMGLVAGLAMGGGNASVVAALRGGASSEDVKAATSPAAPPVAEVPPTVPPAVTAAEVTPPVAPPQAAPDQAKLQQMFRELGETSGLPTEPEVTPAAPEVTPPAAAPVAEAPVEEPAAAPPAPAEPRGLFAPPQSELPPLPTAEPVTAKEPLPDIVVPAGFKAKEGRTPQLVFAARALAEGKITKDQYDEYVERYKPITEVIGDKLETPIEDALMTRILTKEIRDKKKPELVNAPIADGTRVGLRMDIPALDWGRENGVNGSVVSIHKGESPKRKTQGENISYKSTGRIKNVVFAPRSEEDAFKIAQQAEPEVKTKKTGEKYLKKVADKKPQQTMEGEWVNTSPEETMRLVRENLNDPNWVQVSLDPLRHSFFYARDSKRPVLSADEALQVGRFVLVKNPVYGDRQQFLYNIESILDEPAGGYFYQSSPSYKREAKKLTRAYEKGKITSDEFARRMGILKTEDEQLKKESVELVRGADHLVSKLRAAVRKGELSPEAVQLAQWFIDNNPQLVDDLAISLTSPKQGGVGGMYESFARLMTLIKFKGDKNTVIHEILHHLERMMPTKVQQAIKKEWTKRLLDAQKQAKGEKEKFFFDALINHHFDEGVIGDIPNAPKLIDELNNKGFKLTLETPSIIVVKKMLQGGIVPIGNYQYYSPSEFWAVNGSNIVRGRYEAIRGGVLTRLKNWLRELGQKIKAIFGLASDAPIIRALDSLAKSDGQFVTDDLLDQAQTLFSVKPSKKKTDTPEFKRWFGDSKVVDENGDPLVMYHGTTADFDVFDTTRRAIAGEGSFFSSSPMGSFAAGVGGNIMPVYLSIKNPKVIDLARESDDVFKDKFIKQGHDGVVMMFEGKIQTAVAFYPEQIKSAIGNIGTFDPTDPNILYSIGPEAKPAPREAKPAKTIEPSKIDREREAWTVGRDELGRPNFGPGAKAYDAVARLANIALDKIAMKPISPELSRAMRNMKVHIGKVQKKVSELGKELSRLSPQERALISDVIEGEVQAGINPPQHILDYAAAMVEIMNKQGQELVRLGMLSKEAYNRWENRYLPRFYEKKLGDETKAWAQAAKRLLMKEPTMQGVKGKQLKSRGMYKNVYVEDLPEWTAQGWEQRDPSFDPKTSTETVVWRDYTREEREKMGEIRDAMFRFVMGYNASQRDIALGRLYENLAENYASKSPAEGLVQVPDTKVEGTGAYRYGKLAGMYVPKEIMDHLVWNDQAMNNGLYKLYRAGLGRWKEGKTVLNPTAHANNVFSNFTMAHFAGVSYWDVHKYAGALRDFVKNNDRLKEAEDIGLFTGTFSQAEMVENMPPELKKLANMTESQIAKYGDKAWDLLSYTIEWDGKKYGVRPVMKWMYENEDFFFRYLIYSDARNRGMEPEDAREYSNQFIFTYDDLPAGARAIRDIGMPFFSYTYKVVPVLARTALEYPWRFAAPAAAVYTINTMMYAIAASLGGDDDDWWGKVLYKYVTDEEFRKQANKLEEEERKNLPPWMKGKSSLGTEKAIRLGMDDVTGLPLFMDISRIFPGGDLLDAENNAGGVALLQPLVPSNPVFTTLVAMFANKDMFLGKDVVNKNIDTPEEQARKQAAWLWKQWAPAISVGNYHFDRAMNTISNMTGEPITLDAGPMGVVDYTGVGRDGLPVIPKYAAMQTFGVKVRPYDLETTEEINKSQQNKLIRELAAEIRRIDRLEEKGAISERAAGIEREKLERKKELVEAGLTVGGKEKK